MTTTRAKFFVLSGIVAATTLLVWASECGSRRGTYRLLIERLCAGAGVDPDLVEAVVHVESGSRAAVVSSRGAIGLMQLMPATAAEVGASLGIDLDPSMLQDPELNLRIGIEYLARLLRHFGSVELALAAYNAGPTRVQRWRDERPDLSPHRLIEETAFEETRQFVSRVLSRYSRSGR